MVVVKAALWVDWWDDGLVETKVVVLVDVMVGRKVDVMVGPKDA